MLTPSFDNNLKYTVWSKLLNIWETKINNKPWIDDARDFANTPDQEMYVLQFLHNTKKGSAFEITLSQCKGVVGMFRCSRDNGR